EGTVRARSDVERGEFARRAEGAVRNAGLEREFRLPRSAAKGGHLQWSARDRLRTGLEPIEFAQAGRTTRNGGRVELTLLQEDDDVRGPSHGRTGPQALAVAAEDPGVHGLDFPSRLQRGRGKK